MGRGNATHRLALAMSRELKLFGNSVRSITTETKGGVLTSITQAEKAGQKLVAEVQTRGAAQVATLTKTMQQVWERFSCWDYLFVERTTRRSGGRASFRENLEISREPRWS